MHWTPDDIAATIGDDPAVKAEDILYKYLTDEATVRFEPLREYFSSFGLNLTEQEMVRLMVIQEDILFTEGADDRGRFWRASIAPNQYAGPASEGYLDHRVTDQYEDTGHDFDANGEEEDFTGRDLAGINATPDAGEMNSLNGEDAPSNLSAFDTQADLPDAMGMATDETEIPPAAMPRAMPDVVAQAMATQMPGQMPGEMDEIGAMADQMGAMPGQPGMPGQPELEPGLPEPGMQPGPENQIDMEQPPAEPGPGEELPAPQTGPTQPQMMPGQMIQPQVAQPQIAVPVQPQMAATAPAEPNFGQDGADYTIDPFLNALKGVAGDEETNRPQAPGPKRYSQRMREARELRLSMLSD